MRTTYHHGLILRNVVYDRASLLRDGFFVSQKHHMSHLLSDIFYVTSFNFQVDYSNEFILCAMGNFRVIF